MTDLSNRIMTAWLKANPEPRPYSDEMRDWDSVRFKLKVMLDIKAYESAVIQFLLPKGWSYVVWMYGSTGGDEEADVSLSEYHPGYSEYRGQGPSLAEALLNAIEAATTSEGN